MNRVLIYGGSFDPPHMGHMTLLADAMACLDPHLAILIPAYKAPLKDGHMASFKDRRDMLEETVKYSFLEDRRRRIAVSDFEMQMGRRVYSHEVVESFSRRLRGSEIYFLVGSDTLGRLHEWKKLDKFARRCVLLVGIRPGSMVGVPQDYPGQMMFVPRPATDISSTEIRRRLVSQEDVSSYVAPGVRSIISDRRLYTLADLFDRKPKWKTTRRSRSAAA